MLTSKFKIRSCNQILACIQSGRRSFSQAKEVKETQSKPQKEEKYAPISPVWSAFSEHGHPVQRAIRDWDSLLRSTPRSKISHKELNGLRLPKIAKIDMSFRFKTPAKQPNRQVMDGFNFLRLLSDQKPLISLGKEGHGNTIISVKVTVRDETRVNGIVTQLKKYADLFQASDEVPKAGLTINPMESNDEYRNLAAELSFAIRNYSMFLNESVHPGITIPGNYANVGATLRFTIRVENLERDFDVVPFLFQCGIGKFVSKGETGFQKVILSKRTDLVPEEYTKELQEELRLLDLKRRGFLVGGVDKRAEAKKEQETREAEAKKKESESKDKKAAASPKPK